MNSEVFTLYQHTNRLNGKRYIGVTKNLTRRKSEHARGLKGAGLLGQAVKKYGIGTFDFQILAVFDDVEAVAYHEQAAILALGTLAPNGYNLRAGAPGTQYAGPMSAETREKISRAKMGSTFTLSPEACIARSETNRVTWANPEVRKNRTAGLRAAGATPEFRAKVSASKMGNKSKLGLKLSAETRARIAAANSAYWAEAKKTGADVRIGRKKSDETRAKLSATMKAVWAVKRNGE